MSLYHTLHATAHAKSSHVRVHYRTRRDCVSLAWVAPEFELYCVAANSAAAAGATPSVANTTTAAAAADVGDGSSSAGTTSAALKAALTHAANRVVQWVAKQEENLFIIGGAVSLQPRLYLPFFPKLSSINIYVSICIFYSSLLPLPYFLFRFLYEKSTKGENRDQREIQAHIYFALPYVPRL